MNIQNRMKINPYHALSILIVILIVIGSIPQLSAEEVSHGEMAGIIRTAGHPCARVLDLQRTGKNSWNVKCNSGSFLVTRDTNGEFTIAASDQ